jgi:hypothetical protein
MNTTGPTMKRCDQTITLPKKHFAILFEGAWVFTPEGEDRILATCPITDDCGTHECTFGIWSGSKIDSLKGFPSTMHAGRTFHVEIDGFEPPDNFHTLFTNAAANYPFVYLPTKARSAGKSTVASFSMNDMLDHKKTRQVFIPLPNLVVADGAVVSAEIDGIEIDHCSGAPVSARRPVITLIFVYEYCDASATATVKGHLGEKAIITANEDHPIPHLIFNIHPTADMKMDEAGQKCHTTATFETLRQAVSKVAIDSTTGKTSSPCCDIAIYHELGCLKFCYGNSGLDQYELGLAKHIHGPDLASCASGNMAVGG